MPPTAHIAHSTRGRTRLRVPARRGDQQYFRQLAERLCAIEGIHDVSANPFTASVLIQHEEDPALLQHVAELRLFQVVPPEVEEMNPALTLELARKLTAADERVRAATRGRLDLNSGMILALLGAGAFQILRGDILPAGGSLFWYAFGLAWLRHPKAPQS